MYIDGLTINNGNINGLTYLQRNAILCMRKEKERYLTKNKAILVTSG